MESADGVMDVLSEGWRPLAERLAGLTLDDRQGAWDAFLCGQPNRDELVEAIAHANPSGPPPDVDAAEATEADGWGPIRLGSLPPAEPFPLSVLPEPAARLVIEGAAAIGCPPDFLGVAMLAVAGGTIGRSVSLRLKPGYFAGPTLYAACVGPPSDGKTPAFKAVTTAARRIDAILAAEHAQAMERWQDEANRTGPDNKKTKPTLPPKPGRIDVDDITMESVPTRLADNPRGLIMLRDELTALLHGMNQYKGGKGNDRSIALKIWSGDAIKKDRVSDVSGIPVRCDHPCMSILGGLPPAMLGCLQDAKGSADGFVDRFLFTYPDPIPVPEWSDRGIPEDAVNGWCEVVAGLWARPMNCQEGRSVPHVARFTPGGEAAWQALYDAHAAEMNAPDFSPALRGPWGKLREYAGRLALILACLDHAADPTSAVSEIPAVGPELVEGAWQLVAYFKNHARRVHMAIGQGAGIGASMTSKALVAWLRDRNLDSFSESEFKQDRRWVQGDDLEGRPGLPDREERHRRDQGAKPAVQIRRGQTASSALSRASLPQALLETLTTPKTASDRPWSRGFQGF